MIDVLYIKGKPSLSMDLELKYSLRTLEQNAKGIGRVFITGECPEFINKDKIIFTPEEDIGSPMINHWWKVKQTIERTDISKRFVLMYDDIFFTKEVEIETYPFYQKGFLHQIKTGGPVYRESLYNAAEWLLNHGKTMYDFELHVPCIYDKNKFKKLTEVFEKIKGEYPAMAVRSVYANLFEKERPFRSDIKFRTPNESPEDLPEEADCLSVSDSAFRYKVLPWLEKNYPERSKYEK